MNRSQLIHPASHPSHLTVLVPTVRGQGSLLQPMEAREEQRRRPQELRLS